MKAREMSTYNYAQNKFSTAIEILAVSDLPLRDRLNQAFLHIRSLDSEKHLPEDLRDDFRRLKEIRLADMGELSQTALKISNLAHRIELLYYKERM
jgi:hypothetical protein